jgi:hypothetical protein
MKTISSSENLHCPPLKLFDYWERGMPAVSTPSLYLRDYADLAYTSGTADEVANVAPRDTEASGGGGAGTLDRDDGANSLVAARGHC